MKQSPSFHLILGILWSITSVLFFAEGRTASGALLIIPALVSFTLATLYWAKHRFSKKGDIHEKNS